MAISDSWPAPAALSGVKNRKKPIFKIASAAIVASSGSLDVADVVLTLESRVLALGSDGRALANVLLGQEELASGKVTRHEQLAVLRLGPELAGYDAPLGDHRKAVVKALQASKPQVVVLDDSGMNHGGWARAFNELVRGEALKSFKGAVVVCSSEETFALRSACEERWAVVNNKLRQGPFGNGGLEIIEDALSEQVAVGKAMPKRRAREMADGTAGLLAELRDLSLKWFEEDIEAICRNEGWTLTLFVGSVSDENGRLKGYMCYETRAAPLADLHVHRVCVTPRLRGRGLGSVLMKWAMEKAQQLPDEMCRLVTTHSIELAVPFYTKLGFMNRGEKEVTEGEDEQFYMDWDASLDTPAAGM